LNNYNGERDANENGYFSDKTYDRETSQTTLSYSFKGAS
jgi:hypothetical protein